MRDNILMIFYTITASVSNEFVPSFSNLQPQISQAACVLRDDTQLLSVNSKRHFKYSSQHFYFDFVL